MTAISSRNQLDMKEDFAFITIIITVYHFWMYSHLVSFKCKSGHWTAHVVTHGSLTMMIHSGIGRENIRAPLLSLRENNRFDLCLFSWKHRTQQNKKKPWVFPFFLCWKQKVATALHPLYPAVCLFFSFVGWPEEQIQRGAICSTRSRVDWSRGRWGELTSPDVKWSWSNKNREAQHHMPCGRGYFGDTLHNCGSAELEAPFCRWYLSNTATHQGPGHVFNYSRVNISGHIPWSHNRFS